MSKKKKPAWQKAKKLDDARIIHAGEEGIPYLYRYLPFPLEKPKPDRDNGPEKLKDILVNRRIRCSNPKYFNDPWDCKPCVHPDLLDDSEMRRIMAMSLIDTQKGGPKGDITDLRLLHDPAFLRRIAPAFNDFMARFITERWGIVCLSAAACSTLMWSHYSDNHKGICLEFRVKGTFFGAAVKIIYRAEYPKMIIGGNFGQMMLTVKAKDWEKEEEYRLACPLSEEVTESKESPLLMKDGFLEIGDLLHAVIMGCEVGEEEERIIKELLEEHGQHVRLKRAVRVPHKYTLTLEDVYTPG
jgi:hypothetical protein